MRVDVLGIDVTVVDVLKIHIDVTALSSSDCFEKKCLRQHLLSMYVRIKVLR